jgi:hypothetical protein
MIAFLFTLAWWAAVISSFYVAQAKNRNRAGWTIAALFVPLITLAIVALLPARRTGPRPEPSGWGTIKTY